MFQGAMSNSTLSQDETLTSNINNNNNNNNTSSFNPLLLPQNTSNNIIQQPTSLPKKVKKKRNLPGNPDPDAEVIALSPKSLLATNRFVCEICSKGFQRDQNLQLHRRGHNLPWKLKQRNKLEVVRKKAYVCPETSCVHHHPSRALGDLTGIKKHFCRKHGEKKFKCEKCSKIYAVHSDWKAHSKTCGTREYRCDCGTLFSRKDSFITHRAFCDALAEESARLSTNPMFPPPQTMPPPPPPPFSTLAATQNPSHLFPFSSPSSISLSSSPWNPSPQNPNNLIHVKSEINHFPTPSQQQQQTYFQPPSLFSKGMMTSPFTSDTNSITTHFLSATALLQKATAVGATLQLSQQSQQAQTMLNGFDELGPSFRPVGPTNNNNHISPFLLSSTNTITTTTTATTPTPTNNYYNHNHQNMNMSMSMDMAHQGNFATWKKSEQDTTRDFLGLTNRSEVGFDEDDMEGNMLKFTGGLQYNHHMTTSSSSSYDHDTSSPTSMLLKPHHQQVHDNQGNFGSFIPSETSTNGATLDSRWG